MWCNIILSYTRYNLNPTHIYIYIYIYIFSNLNNWDSNHVRWGFISILVGFCSFGYLDSDSFIPKTYYYQGHAFRPVRCICSVFDSSCKFFFFFLVKILAVIIVFYNSLSFGWGSIIFLSLLLCFECKIKYSKKKKSAR